MIEEKEQGPGPAGSPANGVEADPRQWAGLSDDLPPENVQPAAKAPPAGVSLMITQQQKADLRERGYSDYQIRGMKPEKAHRVLGLIK